MEIWRLFLYAIFYSLLIRKCLCVYYYANSRDYFFPCSNCSTSYILNHSQNCFIIFFNYKKFVLIQHNMGASIKHYTYTPSLPRNNIYTRTNVNIKTNLKISLQSTIQRVILQFHIGVFSCKSLSSQCR